MLLVEPDCPVCVPPGAEGVDAVDGGVHAAVDALGQARVGVRQAPDLGALEARPGHLGTAAIRRAAALLRDSDLEIDYAGFVEGTDVTTGKVDMFTVLTEPETGAAIGEPRSVTPDHQAGTALYPRWSPDGRYLAPRADYGRLLLLRGCIVAQNGG